MRNQSEQLHKSNNFSPRSELIWKTLWHNRWPLCATHLGRECSRKRRRKKQRITWATTVKATTATAAIITIDVCVWMAYRNTTSKSLALAYRSHGTRYFKFKIMWRRMRWRIARVSFFRFVRTSFFSVDVFFLSLAVSRSLSLFFDLLFMKGVIIWKRAHGTHFDSNLAAM